MGLAIQRENFDDRDFARFAVRLEESLEVLAHLLERPGFGEGPPTLGAELELTIVDRSLRALPVNRHVLAESMSHRAQLEIDRFNLEYNLTPVPLAGSPFAALERELAAAVAELDRSAAPLGGRVVAIGILPTLCAEDLQSSAMSDGPRYRALSTGIRRMREVPFEIHIEGEDRLRTQWSDVTLEGASTSLQVHLRVSPAEFADVYNAAQMATPVVLAVAGNSPTLLARRLWEETRVALCEQAVDERRPDANGWRRPARVSYGNGWVRRGALELFGEAISLHAPLLPATEEESPWSCLRDGGLPRLYELRLHQSTVWRWNRAIYDPGAGGHLRIEMRALPSGPTPIDMAANAAFLVGLSAALAPDIERSLAGFPFTCAEANFYRAARLGLDATFFWGSPLPPSPLPRAARDVVAECLPKAASGLASLGVEDREIGRLLRVIEGRLDTGRTPARWQRRMLERLERRKTRFEALREMLAAYLLEAASGLPVHEWGGWNAR